MDPLHPTTLASPPEQISDAELQSRWNRVVGRRSFLLGIGAAGAAAVAPGMFGATSAFADGFDRPTRGDMAILRFLAAAEILETDLWQQYTELGGVNGGNPAYIAALENLDGDMPQYIDDNTDDEASHAAFLNAYLRVEGRRPRQPRRLPHAAEQQGDRRPADRAAHEPDDAERRHELVHPLPQHQNPDFGATFPQAVDDQRRAGDPGERRRDAAEQAQRRCRRERRAAADAGDRQHRRVPLRDDRAGRLEPLHDAGLKVTSLEVLRIVVSIGGTEVEPLRHLARQGRKRRRRPAGRRHGSRDRRPLPRPQRHPAAASCSRRT